MTVFERFPCLMCKTLHPDGECTLLTEPLQVLLPEWLDKLFRARVPAGERSAFVRGLLERELSS